MALFSGEDDLLGAAARRFFGLEYLFPYQRLVISNILEARSSAVSAAENSGFQIVILPTGAGKSLCFQLPAMLLSGPTLVIYPILSLMADQGRRLNELAGRFDNPSLAPVTLRGGQDEAERREIFRRVRAGESRFIIANPEVLLTEKVLEALGGLGIAHAVIDEAHCVSEWGESFRPSYLRIGEIIAALRKGAESRLLVTAFTATAGAPVLEKIETYIFRDPQGGESPGVRRIVGNPDRSNIEYAAQGTLVRNLAVRDLLIKNKLPAIVFCSSREGTERLARCLLSGSDFPQGVRFYHAGLDREEKADVEKWFFASDGGVLVATCAYGMGVDKSNIRTVIHRDCPPSVEAYLQESGRAGRDGLESRAVLLWGPDDELALERTKSGEERQRMTRLLDYARDSGHCRRAALQKLLDYRAPGAAPESPEKGCCDVCGGAADSAYREERSLADFFRRNRRCYTLKEAAVVLAASEQIRWSEEEAEMTLKHLIRMGKLKTLRNPLWKGTLSPGKTILLPDPDRRHRFLTAPLPGNSFRP
jgi:ATP-dependent DNA helicase RecQ